MSTFLDSWIDDMVENDMPRKYVYFALCEGDGFDPMLKVGTSKDPYTRVKSLRKNPGKCGDWMKDYGAEGAEILGTVYGDEGLERLLHRKFEKYRVAGEWFWYEPISYYISELLDDHCVCALCNIVDTRNVVTP